MKVVYLSETDGRNVGDVIDIDGFFAKSLINSGLVEKYSDKTSKEPIHKDVLDEPEVITPKKKGNPNWGKKQ